MSYVQLSGGFSGWFTPSACGPGHPELSQSYMDMASKLFTFTSSVQQHVSCLGCRLRCTLVRVQVGEPPPCCLVVRPLVVAPSADRIFSAPALLPAPAPVLHMPA